jgi:hypothetical protein
VNLATGLSGRKILPKVGNAVLHVRAVFTCNKREDNVTFIRGPLNVWNSKIIRTELVDLLKRIGKNGTATSLLLL